MTRSLRTVVVIHAAPRSDGALSVVEVRRGLCVLSTGEELILKYEKAQMLAEQVCQEQAAIRVRTWWTPDGVELIELHRCGETPSLNSTAIGLKTEIRSDDVF